MTDIDKRLDSIEQQLTKISNTVAFPPLGSQYIAVGQNDEIDLKELWDVLWRGKWIVIGIILVFAVVSVFYAKSLPNIYKAQALLAPSGESQGGGMAALAGQFNGIASLAGVNLGSGGGDKTVIAMEVMKSRQFVNSFIDKYSILVPLIAAESWDSVNGKLIIDPKLYDESSEEWVRVVKAPKTSKPSAWEGYKEFVKIFSVSRDKTTSLITVSVEHYSPALAKFWVASLVKEINAYMRENDVAEATKSIHYLTNKLNSTPVADMRMVFSQMVEEQTKVMMLSEVREEYVFSTIDPAVEPEEKAKPKRSLICVLGVVLGGVFGLMIVLIRHFAQSNKIEMCGEEAFS